MNHRITAIRTNLARGTLLAVMWLNMAITPCAMAFESDDHDCPHCPPAEEHAMAGHHGHGEVERSCATMQSECCELAEAAVESRTEKSQSKSSSDIVQIGAPVLADLFLPNSRAVAAADPPDPPGVTTRLHVLNCVYLD